MKRITTFKCLCCSEQHPCEPRSKGRQHYCSKPSCRRASKAASQRRWLSKSENKNYFCGSEHVERVRRWRKRHPGYWRKKRPQGRDALQETLKEKSQVQPAHTESVANKGISDALQDICNPQPALLVGLISFIGGHALQDDIAATARSFLIRGEDILRMGRGGSQHLNHENQNHFVPAEAALCATPV